MDKRVFETDDPKVNKSVDFPSNTPGINNVEAHIGNVGNAGQNAGTLIIGKQEANLFKMEGNASIRIETFKNFGSKSKEYSSEEIAEFKLKLQNYYQRNATIKLPVFDKHQHVKDSYVHLALVDNNNKRQAELIQLHRKKQGDNISLQSVHADTLDSPNLWTQNSRIQTWEDIYKVENEVVDIKKLFDNNWSSRNR